MPNVDTIKGIKINVYSNDHVPPHAHALYADDEALVDIRTRKIIGGNLPKKQTAILKKYILDNHEELLELFYELNPKTKLS